MLNAVGPGLFWQFECSAECDVSGLSTWGIVNGTERWGSATAGWELWDPSVNILKNKLICLCQEGVSYRFVRRIQRRLKTWGGWMIGWALISVTRGGQWPEKTLCLCYCYLYCRLWAWLHHRTDIDMRTYRASFIQANNLGLICWNAWFDVCWTCRFQPESPLPVLPLWVHCGLCSFWHLLWREASVGS